MLLLNNIKSKNLGFLILRFQLSGDNKGFKYRSEGVEVPHGQLLQCVGLLLLVGAFMVLTILWVID